MALAIILISCVPIGLIILIFCMIIVSSIKIGKAGKLAYKEMKPHIDGLQESVSKANKRGLDLTSRGQKLAETWKEIGETFSKIGESFQEIHKSPLVKIADYAGRIQAK